MLKSIILWISTLLTVIACADQSLEQPQVVVTIKPIHALVSGVMKGVGTPHLLLQGGESPHSYSLRPSQIPKIHHATLVVWVGPTVETFLEKPMVALGHNTPLLRLLDLQDLTILERREGDEWEKHLHSDFHQSHQVFDIDPHIWLDPHNAKIIVQAVTQRLRVIDTPHAERYTANATRLIHQLDQLDQTLKHQLASLKELPYLVFHDAYHYFEHRYGLKAVGTISLSPEIHPSAKWLHQLRVSLKKQQIRCIFSEPQFESALIATLIEGTSVQRGILDPLGAKLKAGPQTYFTLLHDLAQSLNQCLLGTK